jgi:amidohydrolase
VIDLVELRRDLHAHPELARQERRTTDVVVDVLQNAGLKPRVLASGTGLICDVGSQSGPTIALRADLDALPVQDQKSVSYRSTTPGVAHACGHDAHTTILTGVALQLVGRASLNGTVRLIFQPAEESPMSGALDVIAEGGLEQVDAIFALHCDPSNRVGHIGTRVGAITSAQDRIGISLHGPGGHSARPDLTPNPIDVMARLITSLPDVVNKQLSAGQKIAIGFGSVSSQGVANAIPSHVEATGTVRIPDAELWPEAPRLVEEAVATIVSGCGLQSELGYQRVCPAVVNDFDATSVLLSAARELVGAACTYEAPQSLGGEDFAWYLRHVPGALARLGVRIPTTDQQVDLHSGFFDIDERAIPIGVDLLVDTAVAALQAYSRQRTR